MTEDLVIDGVRLTNPDKILYPEQAISKRRLADYYCAVAQAALRHLARRPISLVRCPVGRQKKCFFQRHAGSGIPEQIRQVPIPGFEEPYLYIEDRSGLVALVQMGALEIHPWGCRTDRPDRPDRLIFDLDPGEGVGFASVVEAAHEMRQRLARLDLECAVKTTGGKGLHVVVPIERRYGWAEVKSFARGFAEEMAASAPSRYLTRLPKAERRGRIFLDYLRNDPTASAVAAYSTIGPTPPLQRPSIGARSLPASSRPPSRSEPSPISWNPSATRGRTCRRSATSCRDDGDQRASKPVRDSVLTARRVLG